MSQTTIYEMRELVDGSLFGVDVDELLTPDTVDRYPHRDVDRLRDAVENNDTARAICEELGCKHRSAKRWAKAYRIDGYPHQEQHSLAARLLKMDSNEVSG